jgi:tetratricopeptide (TPR) repeat protein
MLPRTRNLMSAGGALSQKNADAAFEQYKKLAEAKDDYSQAQMAAMQRSKEANMDDRIAMAAQYAGPKFSNVRDMYLKKAMAGREPTRVGNVMIGPDGTVVRDAAADRMKQAELQLRLGEKYAEDANRDEARADRDYQINVAQDDRNYQRERNVKTDAAAANKLERESGIGFGATKSGGFTPEGVAVMLSKNTTPFILVGGVPTEYSGEIKYPSGAKDPTEDMNKAASWYKQAAIGYEDMQRAMKEDPNVMFKSQEEAIKASIPFIGSAIANRGMTPQRQVYTGGVDMVVEAFLRGATGAGITNPETIAKIKAVAPAVYDSAERIAQKSSAIPKLIQTLQQRAGRALTQEQRDKVWEEELDNFDQGLSPPPGVPANVWNGMSQAEKDEYDAAGELE